jgi:hypothetical protein
MGGGVKTVVSEQWTVVRKAPNGSVKHGTEKMGAREQEKQGPTERGAEGAAIG